MIYFSKFSFNIFRIGRTAGSETLDEEDYCRCYSSTFWSHFIYRFVDFLFLFPDVLYCGFINIELTADSTVAHV